MKECSKCKTEKSATSEYFCKQRKNKDGLSYNCKDCDREYRKQQKTKNKKKIFIYDDKKVKECNECKIEKPTTPEYFNKDIKMKDGLFNICKECRNEYDKKRYQKNREEILEYNREYYRENRDYHREYNRKYSLKNPEVVRLNNQRRKARMAELPNTLTNEEWEEALEYFNHSCAYCGVSDDSVGKEHIIPVVKGGGYTQENIIPACRSCNSSKRVADMKEWYLKYEHYSEGRLSRILNYIKII